VLARVALAAGVAAVLTVAQLGLVAWMNRPENAPEPAAVTRAPVPVVAPPRQPQAQPEPEPTAALAEPTLQAPSPQPLALVEPSALADLPDTRSPSDHIAVLPGLGAGDLGGSMGPIAVDVVPDTAARPTRRPPPSYPPSAKRRRIEGFVIVRLRIDDTGRVIDAVVVEAEPEGVFDDAAVRTARRYRFEPAMKNGKAAADTVEQRIVFRLRQ